jgi:hypothetical protein
VGSCSAWAKVPWQRESDAVISLRVHATKQHPTELQKENGRLVFWLD